MFLFQGHFGSRKPLGHPWVQAMKIWCLEDCVPSDALVLGVIWWQTFKLHYLLHTNSSRQGNLCFSHFRCPGTQRWQLGRVCQIMWARSCALPICSPRRIPQSTSLLYEVCSTKLHRNVSQCHCVWGFLNQTGRICRIWCELTPVIWTSSWFVGVVLSVGSHTRWRSESHKTLAAPHGSCNQRGGAELKEVLLEVSKSLWSGPGFFT